MKIINCKLKILSRGITLIELIVVIFLITIFSMIVLSDFPKIMKQHALSSVTHKLAKDLRKVEDMGLSGVTIYDANKEIILVKGYGVYFNIDQPTQYIIYADVPGEPGQDGIRVSDQKYYVDGGAKTFCNTVEQDELLNLMLIEDCILEIIDISKENSSLSISDISSVAVPKYVSINFTPPNPDVNIDNIASGCSKIFISLSNNLSTRIVSVNKAGLINIE
jgi:competence protein ComGC